VFIGGAGVGSSDPEGFLVEINNIWGGYFVYVKYWSENSCPFILGVYVSTPGGRLLLDNSCR
jgi:hypothetical protein